MTATQTTQARGAIEDKAKQLSKRLCLVNQAWMAETLENALLEMAIFAVGQATGQAGAARAILEESSREDAQKGRA